MKRGRRGAASTDTGLKDDPEVTALEGAFAEYMGVRHAVALSSGTAALHLALLAHGVDADDEVVVSPLCGPAVATAILATGANPVYADINPYTYTISPHEAERAITGRTRALLAVHLHGQPCDMSALGDIAKRHGVALLEVAWEALGARYGNVRVGGFGTAVYSFQQGMAIRTGEGGMLTTNDDAVAATVRSLANYGCDCCGRVQQSGFNYRMPGVVAALAREQLPRVDKDVAIQQFQAQAITQGLAGMTGLIPPSVLPGAEHSFQQYALRIGPEFPFSVAEVCRRLKQHGIEALGFCFVPLHLHPFHKTVAASTRPLTNAERAANEMVLVPMHPRLSGKEVKRMVHTLRLMATYVPDDEFERADEDVQSG